MKKILYRVKAGDTLNSVCEKLNACQGVVIEENFLSAEIVEGDLLVVESYNGKTLSKNSPRTYAVRPADTYISLSKKFGVSATELQRLNKLPYLFYGLRIRLE